MTKRSRKVPVPIGTVLEFQVPGGFRYIQLSAQVSAPNAPSYRMTWARVLPGLCERPLRDVADLTAEHEDFHVLLDYADKIPIPDGVRIAGTADVPPSAAVPVVTRALAHPVGDRTRWRIRGPGDATRVVWSDQLSEADADIPLRYLHSMDQVQQILSTGWHPRASVFSSRIVDTPEVRQAERDFAARRHGTVDFQVTFPRPDHARSFEDALSARYPDLSIDVNDADDEAKHPIIIGHGHERRLKVAEAIEQLANTHAGDVIRSGTYVGP